MEGRVYESRRASILAEPDYLWHFEPDYLWHYELDHFKNVGPDNFVHFVIMIKYKSHFKYSNNILQKKRIGSVSSIPTWLTHSHVRISDNLALILTTLTILTTQAKNAQHFDVSVVSHSCELFLSRLNLEFDEYKLKSW